MVRARSPITGCLVTSFVKSAGRQSFGGLEMMATIHPNIPKYPFVRRASGSNRYGWHHGSELDKPLVAPATSSPKSWGDGRDSNPRSTDYKSAALPLSYRHRIQALDRVVPQNIARS
jgi:hypothetical protein